MTYQQGCGRLLLLTVYLMFITSLGKSTLLKIMAGVEKTFEGVAVPMPGTAKTHFYNYTYLQLSFTYYTALLCYTSTHVILYYHTYHKPTLYTYTTLHIYTGASVGYLPQEPTLEGETVIDNINLGVKKSQDLLDRYNELSVKCGEDLAPEEMDKV